MSKCYLLLGTNMGDKKSNLEDAARKISTQVGEILTRSSIYLTSAWGKEDQDDYLNQVLCVSSDQQAIEIMNSCLDIENQMGRIRYEKWGSRLIDIDVLYFEDQIISTENCVIPHPELQNRRFTLEPLEEIAPNSIHPVLKKTNKELLAICPDQLNVNKL